ncbi:MAG: hypothetical protein BGP04_18055 [Rhizobiales bacterium 62-17]|nr:iron ABC transporter permease [Hyphomicrobiales bacterium]OJX99601.1 MAG: hypothetical protein BGP04_18055 [Rhizobiales bacterium 62-17]
MAAEGGASATRHWRAIGTDALPTLLLALPLIWLVVLPLVILLVCAFRPTGFLLDPGFTTDHIVTAWTDPDLWRLFARTLHFALGSSLFALLIGTGLAWLVERTDIRGAGLVRALMILPMAMPPFIMAIAWTILLSPRTGIVNLALVEVFGLSAPPLDIYTMTGLIFVEGLSLAPSAFLIMVPAFRKIDAALEEAALMSGAGSLQMLRRVVLPLLLPALAGAAIYLLIVSLVVFDIPGAIGHPVGIVLVSTHVYDLLHHAPTGLPEYGQVSAIAIIIAAALVALCLLYQRLMRAAGRFVTVTGKTSRHRVIPLGRGRLVAELAIAAFVLVAVVAPILAIIWASLLPYQMAFSLEALKQITLANHIAFLSDPAIGKTLGNSLVIAIVASCAVTLLCLLIGWVVVRTKAPGRQIIDILAFMPLAFPGVLIATALIYVYLSVPLLRIYGTIWIIAVAHTTVYLSYGSRAINAAMYQLHADLEEAARMAGAAWFTTLRRVVAPLLVPALAAVWIWVFAHSLRELGSALLLQGRDNATLPTLLFAYWTQGQPAKTAAVAVWFVFGLVLLLAIAHLLQSLAARRTST